MPSSLVPSFDSQDPVHLACTLLDECKKRGVYLACSESLTGGELASTLVAVPGASAVFLGSAVTYHLGAKQHILGVPGNLLHAVGAVNAQVATDMVAGTLKLYAPALHFDGLEITTVQQRSSSSSIWHGLLALSTTGVAGPSSDGFQPVGTVFVGAGLAGGSISVEELHLHGDRSQIRRLAVTAALHAGLREILSLD